MKLGVYDAIRIFFICMFRIMHEMVKEAVSVKGKKHSFKWYMAVVLASCSAFYYAGTSYAEESRASSFGVYQVNIETISEGDNLKFEYPVVTGIDGFDQNIVDAVNQHFYEEAVNMMAEEGENLRNAAEELKEYNPEAAAVVCAEVTCESVYLDGDILSVEQFYYSYYGGVHGYNYPFGTTYDLRTGGELTMGGILGCDETTAQNAVVEAYRKDIIGKVENITEEDIRGCFDLMEYWVQPEGMYVNIAPYNVASYAAGQQQAIVTPEILSAVQNGTTEAEMITVINGIQAPASDFILPYSSIRTITDEDLKKLEGASVEEEHYRSQLAINEILARYGYVFHPENGGASKEAYDQFNGKTWYEQAKACCPSDSANEMLYTYLSSIELDNVNIICEWQKVHNCYY